MPVATLVARTTNRFTLDSERQIARIEAATVNLNGELIGSDAEAIAQRLQSWAGRDLLPREVFLELNTTRATRPLYWPGRYHAIERGTLRIQSAAMLF